MASILLPSSLSRRATLLALALAPLAGAVHAQAGYPDRPIKLIVPFAPSGSTDLAARLIAEFAGRELGQPIVVENKAGAGGSLGMEQVAKARADGYTLGMATMSTHGSNAAAYGSRMKYDPVKDFAPVSNVATVPSVFAVNANFPARTMQEFIALARANPGKYNFASPGTGSLGHANVEHFSSLAKIQLLHIPYKGAGMALNDAVAGQVDGITDNLPSALPHIKSGKLRALGVTSAQRSAALPDVPTIAEAGPVKGFDASSWFGLFAPAGTPTEIVARINQETAKAFQSPAFKERLLSQGAIPGGQPPAEFAKFIAAETAKWAQVVKVSGAKVD